LRIRVIIVIRACRVEEYLPGKQDFTGYFEIKKD